MKKIPMILLAMFTLSGCDRQEMIYSFNHVEEASVDNEVENTESVDNIQAETEQAVDITTEEPEISDVYSGPTVTLAMVGDVLLHTPVEESCQAEDGSYDFSSLFANVKDEVQAADIAIVNQEVIIGGEELGVSGYPSFNAPYEVADALAETGFDVILHGTNHAMDQGKKGITNCLSNWEKKHPDIKILGINKSQDAQDSVTVLEQNGIKIAVLNYTYGLNGIALPQDMPYAVNLLDEEKVVSEFLSRISFFFFTLFLKCNLCFSIILCYFTIKVCNTSFYFITMIYRSTDKYSFYFILFLLSGYILPMSEMIWLLRYT